MRKLIALFVALAVPVGHASAQEETRAQLVGAGKRLWIQESIVKFKGASKTCAKGLSFEFNVNGTVQIIECKSGQLSSVDAAWTLKVEGMDSILRIGSDEYHLSFSGEGCKQQARLRKLTLRIGEDITDRLLTLSCV